MDAQVIFLHQYHDSELIFELPANLETRAIIDTMIWCGGGLLHSNGEIQSFKVDMWLKEDKEIIFFLCLVQ